MSFLIAALTFIGISPASAIPPDCEGLIELEDQIECAIQEGLDYMIPLQNMDGYWSDGYTTIATTGLMCVKLIDRAKELGVDPFSEDYEYKDNLVAAINHIAASLQNNMGGLAQLLGNNTTYTTGITAMCLADAANVNPEGTATVADGTVYTYPQITQKLVDWLVAAQNVTECGQGGWYYTGNPNTAWADNSVSGYATLGLGFALSLAGIDISATLPSLDIYIDNVQQNGGDYDGGSIYEPCVSRGVGINTLKTGNLLYELGLVGENQGDDRVDRAIAFIVKYWANNGGDCNGCGWVGDYQAMFTMMKGLEGLGVDMLPNPMDDDIDWFTEVATYIVSYQNNDGHWLHTAGRGTSITDTAWALLTLEKVVPEITKTVPVDIKPSSCPNPLNPKDKGVIPVAVSSTSDFDVTQVDPATVKLAGVSPLRWAYEDVATPFEPFTGKQNCSMDCTTAGADGLMDLSLKFDAQAVVTALGELQDNQCIVVNLTGNLKEEFGSTPIVGEDVMIIRKK